jgi:hypothetical protein
MFLKKLKKRKTENVTSTFGFDVVDTPQKLSFRITDLITKFQWVFLK